MVGKKKTWNKSKTTIKCGECHICNKPLISNEGGWIVNAEKKYFCEAHKKDIKSCFDKYLEKKIIPLTDW